MTDYKRLQDDVRGLKALERIRKTQELGHIEYDSIRRSRSILLKDIFLEGSQLSESIFDVLYTCPISDYENKLTFYDGLLDIAERGRLEL